MITFFAIRNLTEKTLSPCEPWKWNAPRPGEVICADKQARQEWYSTKSTDWQFYTVFEPVVANLRPDKENPPRFAHGLAADYDFKLTDERVAEAVEAMKVRPAWIERSLGGNIRLVWLFSRPVPLDCADYCTFFLQQAKLWLKLDSLPFLDAPAWENPSRLLCNGSEWRETGSGPVPDHELQAFLIKCGRSFRFKGSSETTIPLETVETELRRKYQTFSWPEEFKLDTQGPSFWIAGSTSPMSAMVKSDGMFSFAAHAEKPFYTWTDLLGADFTSTYFKQSITKATSGIFWDGQHAWRKIKNSYRSMKEKEATIFFKVECGLKGPAIEQALSHIHNENRVKGAASFVFRPSGLINYQGEPVLNTYIDNLVRPSTEVSNWGGQGNFPFLSSFLEKFFDPMVQLVHFLAWFKHYYESGLNQRPMPGQNIYLMGPAGVGKTLLSRKIVGLAVGGFSDASDFLVKGDSFGSENYHVPLWAIDDENPTSSITQDRFWAMMKKTSANQQFRYNKKFEVGSMVEWMGRVIVTANLDYVSSRMLSPLDNTSMDKTSIFRVTGERSIFPSRYELEKTIGLEIPHFLAWLVAWVPPAEVIRDTRYGYAAHHEASLLDQSHQTSKAAPFKEILIESLQLFFAATPEVADWRGTLAGLTRFMLANGAHDYVMKSMTLEQIGRYLEQVQREGIVRCRTEIGPHKTRIWIFERFDEVVQSGDNAGVPIIPTDPGNFEVKNEQN